LRIASGLTVEEVACVYVGGSTTDRIREIESSARVGIRIEAPYRAAITGALLLRELRARDGDHSSDFRNPKIAPEAGR
jgi:hypothetical protein